MKSTSSLEGPDLLVIFAFEEQVDIWRRGLFPSIFSFSTPLRGRKFGQCRRGKDGCTVDVGLNKLVSFNNGGAGQWYALGDISHVSLGQ